MNRRQIEVESRHKNKEKAFLSEIENAKAEALIEKEKCHLELTKKEQKQKHRNKVSE